ncbi:MAG: ROK family protein [bacterium]
MDKTKNTLAIGIDLGGTNLRIALITDKGEILKKNNYSICEDRTVATVVSKLIHGIQKLIEDSHLDLNYIAGIGIGAPGIIDIDKGVIISSPNLSDWKKVPLRKIITEKFTTKVILENDANAAAYGEWWMGQKKEPNSLICITLGTGVGGGIILDKKIWHGADGTAGEIGHMTIDINGPLCSCGNNGCLEVFASATGIVSRTLKALAKYKESILNQTEKEKLTSADVYEAAVKGDRLAQSIMRKTGEYLGVGLANLVNLLNVEAIVIAGGVTKAGDLILKPALEEMKKRAFCVPSERVKVAFAELADNAGVIGAAGLAHHLSSSVKVIQ